MAEAQLPDALAQLWEAHNAVAEDLRQRQEHRQSQVEAMRQSRSWQVTKPLRAISRALRGGPRA